jgi:hypothetical protein
MSEEISVTPTADRELEVRKLAEIHYTVDVGITQIFRLKGDPDAERRSNEPINSPASLTR